MENKLVVNFIGAPGSGKTVAAASVFSQLKKTHVPTALVSEFAYQMVIEANASALKNQLYVWANQQFRIFCGYQHSQITVTDSPILLGAIYNTNASEALMQVFFEEYHRYNNFNILVTLDHSRPYSMTGRIHSFTESISIENQIIDLMNNNDIPFVSYDDTTEEDLVSLILESVG
jgi:hypothetical protein